MIQFQTDPDRMPIEDASIEWTQQDSPCVPVARIRIPPQSFDDPLRAARCEHEGSILALPSGASPLGGMNRAAAGDLRRDGRVPNEIVRT